MEFVSEFRDKELAEGLIRAIVRAIEALGRPVSVMEVCGTHTWSIARHGIRSLLPPGLKLLSGPGCPVCVTPRQYIDGAIALARQEGVILTTFGDLLRVPGSGSSLERERAEGHDIRPVYSPLEALKLAKSHPEVCVVFLGVGFEATAPAVAASLLEAREEEVDNYLVYSAHKRVPPVLRSLAFSSDLSLDGFLCPPHVSCTIGARAYDFLAEEKGLGCVIAGFEPLDILQGLWMVLRQLQEGSARVEVQYRRAVRDKGNVGALRVLEEVFEVVPSSWRGLGLIPDSGLRLRKEMHPWDALHRLPLPPIESSEEESEEESGEEMEEGCLCGEILRGVKAPPECPSFGLVCTPRAPRGPCMVSSEGTCAAYYRYGIQ